MELIVLHTIVGASDSHIDPKMPAIALFANQDIKPFTELFFDVSTQPRTDSALIMLFFFLYSVSRFSILQPSRPHAARNLSDGRAVGVCSMDRNARTH